MKIYNATSTQISVPCPSIGRTDIPSMSVSKEFMPNKDFLNMIKDSFDSSEVALIINGQFEIAMCSQVDGIRPLTVTSLEDAISRFAPSNKEENESDNTKNPVLAV